MWLPPAVIVHDVAMARQAVAAAAAIARPLTLLSGAGAGAYAGVGWWQAVISLACPSGDVPHVLDCGDAPGRALAALRAGQRLVVLHAEPRIWEDIAERALSLGGAVLAEAPDSVDLGRPGAARLLGAWLRG